jgi:hypothetical protein
MGKMANLGGRRGDQAGSRQRHLAAGRHSPANVSRSQRAAADDNIMVEKRSSVFQHTISPVVN